ncbi:hypothetical protein D8674_038138 [Pyrus ussuriensis x Pyrus communis]|uniref:Transmembrane protein n=1 Tax=Pyrus ussuriensis x Pyrus communis TaxID=2448454 RepID=A0A5N5IAH7_9ROSA|nr:hypothetical protein D8674_039912 [Pyrus ussuriensis x Pyrus communis]KAB2634690.1 hypothetical protein D8674_038138 [Pyrus ussuriensis x Pyrus communis]
MTAVARTMMVIMVVAVVMVAVVMGYGCVPIEDDNNCGVLVFMVVVAVVTIVVCIKKDNIGSELWKENMLDVVD